MTSIVVAFLIMSALFVLGYVSGAYVRYIGFKKKIENLRNIKYGELKKIFDLTNNRSKVVTKELNDVVGFINDELPNIITTIVLSEPKLAILKSKSGVSDKTYLEALEPVILQIQAIVANRLVCSVNNITAEAVKDIKGLMNENVQAS